MGAIPPGPRRLPGARVVPALDRPLSQHRHTIPADGRGARAAGLSRVGGGRPVVLAFTNHDFRDMRPDVDGVRDMLSRVGREFPGVQFRFSEAVDAMREALRLPAQPAASSRSRSRGRAAPLTSWRFGPGPDIRSSALAGAADRRPAPIITTTSISTSRFTGGATSSTRRRFRSALWTRSEWPPTTPSA